MPSPADVRLERFDPVTGYWRYERTCSPATMREWLAMFVKDAPQTRFRLRDARRHTLASHDPSATIPNGADPSVPVPSP